MKKLTVVLVLVTILAVLTAGCRGYGSSPKTSQASASSSTPSGSPTLSVDISNFAFSPAALVAKQGTTITWTNKDSVAHTVTSDTGLFDSKSLSPGAQFKYTFNSTGTFSYHCTFHAYMKGSVAVQ